MEQESRLQPSRALSGELAGQRTGQAPSGEGMGTEDTPVDNADLSQERGADPQVLGDQVKAEEVPVYPGARHGQAVHVLVFL